MWIYVALVILFLKFSIAKVNHPMGPFGQTNWTEEFNRFTYYVD
jgi:hypothetical protein